MPRHAASEITGWTESPPSTPRAGRSFVRHDPDEPPVRGHPGQGTHDERWSFLQHLLG
jgi:hypothetical protein